MIWARKGKGRVCNAQILIFFMNILIACEFSGIVREAFIKKGHNAVSCDLLKTEIPGVHFVGNIFDVIQFSNYDMMIAFPPCTHLAVSGARWFKYKQFEQIKAIHFFIMLATVEIPKIAIENPIGIMSTYYRKPDQIIQPWQFGHGEIKATCLWLKGLPKLIPTDIVEGRVPRVHHAAPSVDRWKERSRTLKGVAEAMADQWGSYNY
jgi:hypothetical protein